MTLDGTMLEEAGRLFLGPNWKRPIARLLGPHQARGPRESWDLRLPFRWANGERPVPGWIAPMLAQLLTEPIDVLTADAGRTSARSTH